ncbi:ABC transporter [Rhodobacteraceae bacterium (ex Bugula neritina AB1)]|nr:ABC transporter [Rhodobacteraceae bacterium (ex Bugula neritina AB1)]
MRPAQPEAANAYGTALRKLRPALIAIIGFSAIINVLMLTGSIYMLQVYDRVLASGSLPTLMGLFGIVLVLYSFLGFYDFLRQRMLARTSVALDNSIAAQAFGNWIRSGLADEAQGAGQPMRDLNTVRSFVASPAMTGVFDLPFVPLFLGMLFLIHPWLGLLTLAGAGVAALIALATRIYTKEAIRQATMLDTQDRQFSERTFGEADVITAMGMQNNVTTRWRTVHNAALHAGQGGSDPSEAFGAASRAFRMMLQSSILTLGAYLVLQNQISAGMIIASSILSGRALAPIDKVIGQWRGIGRALEAHRSLKEFFATAPERPKPIRMPRPTGALTVSKINKVAPGAGPLSERRRILSQVSFSLEPGDGLGVIGNSAAGKSTLARLLVGIWTPDTGEVRLDGAKHELWDPEALGKSIGYLPQSFDLLPGSIAQNIARFTPDAADEDVIAAATLAGVNDMILKLPDGYATQVGPHAGVAPLSGGQIQRLGLARAVFGLPRLVVLDEPNSNLDVEGDNALTKAIAALRAAGSTVIVMAHRPSAIATVNKVMILHEGRIAQFGDKEEILSAATGRPAPRPQGAPQDSADARPGSPEKAAACAEIAPCESQQQVLRQRAQSLSVNPPQNGAETQTNHEGNARSI